MIHRLSGEIVKAERVLILLIVCAVTIAGAQLYSAGVIFDRPLVGQSHATGPEALPPAGGYQLERRAQDGSVTFVANVAKKISDNAFTIWANESGEEMLVIGVEKFKNHGTGQDLFLEGETIRVTGVVVPFNRADAQRILGIPLEDVTLAGFEGEPVMLAVIVEMQTTIS